MDDLFIYTNTVVENYIKFNKYAFMRLLHKVNK